MNINSPSGTNSLCVTDNPARQAATNKTNHCQTHSPTHHQTHHPTTHPTTFSTKFSRARGEGDKSARFKELGQITRMSAQGKKFDLVWLPVVLAQRHAFRYLDLGDCFGR